MASEHATDLRALLHDAAASGTTDVRWVVSSPTDETDAAASAAGLHHHRDVLQLRRPLPLPDEMLLISPPAATRALVPGSADEEAWIGVNNRAFEQHPDQSGFTPARLHHEMGEPWFCADGFLLHERDGHLAGFCWTKVHPAADPDPALGEIYAIGVDPRFQGLGLGRSLTVAGLSWLATQGLTTGMLYVDADNAPARTLYDRLGFVLHHTDRVYET
jgi:mycothiol synthase